MGNKWEGKPDHAWLSSWSSERKVQEEAAALALKLERQKAQRLATLRQCERAAELEAWHAGRTCGACGIKGHNRTKCPTVPYAKPAKPAKPWTKPYQPPSGPRVPVVVDARLSVGAIGLVDQFRAEDRRKCPERLADEAGLSSPIEKTQAAEKPPGALDGVVTGRIGPTKEELIAELRK